ncbi:MAG: biotin/lipoyl-containing protein [Fervidicoccaceae archaeon]|jgi:pyruvate/2-oxoglutarate dehydrogenase complex dihydrolipoamide acyltransferase (E2) component|uniref:Biotin attachment protein n=1 Tax=Fervidicoccus fontis TaxID=683846 RepID=A0A7C2YJ97_9CREN|nr:MAG: biotin attachment protein [Fervidicoccus sp.]HEU97431.1 biotin attachment protein [Fervidicoccus fontis]
MIVQVPSKWDVSKYGSGVIAEWYKKEGEPVKKGEILCLIMVSKIRVEVESPVDGKIKKIIAQKETEVKPGDPLVEIE